MNLSSLQSFRQFLGDTDLSRYTTDEIALKAAIENDKTVLGTSDGIYTAELILRCRNLFNFFNKKYSTMIEKDRMEEIEYDSLFRSLKHFRTNQQSKFETYFTNQIKLGYIYEFRKMHVETSKQRKERQRREQLVKEGIDTSGLEPLQVITNDDDMRKKLSSEQQDLVFKLTSDSSQSHDILRLELLSMFDGLEKQLVEILISTNYSYKLSRSQRIKLLGLQDQEHNTNNGKPRITRKESQYRQIIMNIAKKLNRTKNTNYEVRLKNERIANNNR